MTFEILAIEQAKQQLGRVQWPEVDATPNALASLSLTPWSSGDITLTCVHPWNAGQWAGKDRCCDYWLTSQAALKQLSQQLTDITNDQQTVVLVITGLTLEDFAEQLAFAVNAFPCAELDFCVRQAQHLAALSREQMHIQTSERQLTRKTTTNRIRALKPEFHLHRSAGALAEAFASDKPPHEIAQAFKQKRINAYQQALEALAALKAPASFTHAYLVDSGQALASIAAPNPNHPLALALAFSGDSTALSKIQEALAL